jgi:hypothetical protein
MTKIIKPKLYSYVVEPEIGVFPEEACLDHNRIWENLERGDDLLSSGLYEEASTTYCSVVASIHNSDAQEHQELGQKALYRYSLSKAFSNINVCQLSAEYFFCAIQIASSRPLWLSGEGVSLEDCAENWLKSLSRSTELGESLPPLEDVYKLVSNVLTTHDSGAHHDIAAGIARLHLITEDLGELIEERLFRSLQPKAVGLLKAKLLNLLKGGVKSNLDTRSPRHEILATTTEQLRKITDDLFHTVNSFLVSSDVNQALKSRQLLLKGINRLRDFAYVHERQLCSDVHNFLHDGLQRYVESRENLSIEELGHVINELDILYENVLTQVSWVTTCYLLPIVAHISLLIEQDKEAFSERYKPELSIEPIKTHWPIANPVSGLEVGVELKNIGNARASEVQAIAYIDQEAREHVSIINGDDFEIECIDPGEQHVSLLELEIIKPSNLINIECLISWKDLNGPQEIHRSIKLLSQDKVDWDLVKNSPRPYSTKSKDRREQLKGRDNILEKLLAGVLASKSYFITGQRRVGKTSIARVLQRELANTGRAVPVYRPWGKLITDTGVMIPVQFFYIITESILEVTKNITGTSINIGMPEFDSFKQSYSRTFEKFLLDFRELFQNLVIVIMIDDVDEMPESFYRSEEGSAFFTAIRSFLDEMNLSFIFIANEKLGSILQAQEGKLNTVVTQKVDYLPRQDVYRLVKEPVQNIFEFDNQALDKIYWLSCGNPYYATLICERVFDAMVSREDYMVADEDIDRSVEEFTRSETTEVFVHFWSDGITTDDPEEISIYKVENARTLIAISRQRSDNQGYADTTTLPNKGVLSRLDRETINERIRGLIFRDVLEGHPDYPDRVRIKVPLFTKWLRGGGASRILETLDDVVYVPHSAMFDIPDEEIIAACRDLVYRGKEIHPASVREFLSQFGRPVDQRLILKLLRRIHDVGYWSERRMRDAVRTMDAHIRDKYKDDLVIKKNSGSRPRIDNLFVTCTGESGSSGPNIVRMIRSEIPDLYSPNIGDFDAIIGKARGFSRNRFNKDFKAVICLYDDFVGSGSSAIGDLEEALNIIDFEFIGWKERTEIFYGVLTGIDSGVLKIEDKVDAQIYIYCYHKLTEKDKAFCPESRIFSDQNELQAALDICAAAGAPLSADHPLGFGDGQALVVFHASVPNNTLPIFWGQGKHWRGAGKWKPLFPRHALTYEE